MFLPLLYLLAGDPAGAPIASDLLGPMRDDQARVFSERPGGTVKARAGKKVLELADGEAVKMIDDNSGAGMGQDTFASIVARKVKAKLPNEWVITNERLQRSPDGRWAVFSTIVTCGDFCYAAGWLFGPGVRKRLAKDAFGTDVVAAWRADGKEVAVGSRSLYLVSLPDGNVVHVDGFCAPAYAPDGRLFVRACGETDEVYEWVRGGKPRKVLSAPGRPPQSDPESPTDFGDPEPVSFERGSLRARFSREDDDRVRSVPLTDLGKDKGAPPPEVEHAVAQILDDATPPKRAGEVAIAQGERYAAFAREIAVAANTRGYRLYQAGKLDEALPLLIAAATVDVTYGMPRFTLARLYARQGNAKESLVYLRMLRVMGKPQRARLEQARKDEAFKTMAGSAEFEAVFK